ncbi:MAG: putative 4-hydroxybenzoate polyprenyltransferase [Planctomycetaceae bacterium]|nr:putative 4-hydroxybenzoate polyprenyltransferase [Planctomycetaceae bacterium]
MIAVLAATTAEAAALVEQLHARAAQGEAYETYRFDAAGKAPAGVIIISGMGPVAAAAATEHLLQRWSPDAVVNVGVCGTLSPELSRGAMLVVSAALSGEDASCEALLCAAGPWSALPAARLVSVQTPLFGDSRRAAFAARADIVDMEGAAVAGACARAGVAVHLVKGVTDFADAAGREDIQANIAGMSHHLAKAVIAGLSGLSRPRPGPGMLARFVKIEHGLFSLPLLLAGAYLGAARAWPSLWTLLLIVVAGTGARILGMATNRIFDRKLDALNARTAARELPSRTMSPAAAIAVAAAGLAMYMAAAAALGPWCLKLSPIPALLMVLYPLGKRFTNLCHFGIGACMAAGPLGAFVAAANSPDLTASAWLLAAFAFLWISGFDIIYALQDVQSDRATGVRSLPASLGSGRAQIVSGVVHLAAAGAAAEMWRLGGSTMAAGAALAVTVAGLALAYWPGIDVRARFFPISVISGVGGALIPILGSSL